MLTAVPKPATVRAPAFRAWLREQPCCVTGERPCDPAHVKTRRNHGDAANMIPLVHRLHQEQHAIGIKSFAEKYGLDLEALARDYWARWHWATWLMGDEPYPDGEPLQVALLDTPVSGR